ncbi:formate dehydrogenase accessory sulfurtransferase FdhD [Methanobrevibacter sp. TMH8]|uniref:formate dehydrogenase accessory sulfurtransferase FdhD n=1 Tax=Methanobrevibacter sp. TMH8 TaxID=2848611 RepID=UPI001CC91103|nr:formate dehydrogenase accessory sulfurtransferase FdhD [Methanobrevibacter sp. TMH8]MBZ9570567.1 formate dehydrogenase accessory sulfurtransferase FdhD [Methanobrevibacter sp. TMH8]
MKITRQIDAIIYKNDEHTESSEELVSDETTTLIINDTTPRNFSTIPNALEDFATGYLIGEGIIKNIDEISKINIDKTLVKIQTKTKEENDDELVLCSDSSGGWRSKIKVIKKVESDLKVEKDDLIKNIEKLRKNASIWQKTGGTHVAAFVNKDKGKFIVREDVSRHVAVDKVIGAAAKERLDFSKSYIIYSGRMPADMVIKIARAGIPILASNAAPSFSGYTTAEKGNITLVGFIRGNRFNVYTHADRILF